MALAIYLALCVSMASTTLGMVMTMTRPHTWLTAFKIWGLAILMWLPMLGLFF